MSRLDLNATRQKSPGRPKNEVPFEDLPLGERILLLYADGKFDAQVCAECELTKEEFEELLQGDKEFKRLISFGRTICQGVWEEAYNKARRGEKNPNGAMLNFAMKNMFGWAEKTETTNTDLAMIENMSRDEALETIRKMLPGITDIAEARERKRA